MNTNKPLNILVTGGSGFLGSHVADALTEAGHNVHIYDMATSLFLKPEQKMIVGNILDAEALNKAMSGVDFVFHLAALADLDKAHHKPVDAMNVNVLGTLNVLEAARLNGVRRVIFASTIYVNSTRGSFYRVSKHTGELLLEVYKERYNLDYTILRFGTLYGTRANESNSVYRYLKEALTTGKIDFYGTGEEVREFIHVLDAARICVKILSDEFVDETLIITGQNRITLSELLSMIREILGDKVEIKNYPQESKSHYKQTPYSYIPRVGKKIVTEIYCDLGQSLVEMLDEIDSDERIEEINI